MALKASDILLRASDLIQDQTNVRWPIDELLRYLNDARREIAIVRPDLYAYSTPVTLVAGTKQSIPSDGSRFLDAVRNVTSAGVIGKAVRVVEREVLDAQRADWHTEASSTELKHFMYDERSPKVFYVYPPATAGHKLEVVYSQTPTDIASGSINSTELLQEDIYTGAMVDYICYRAFSKDAEYAGNAQRAQAHYQQFLNAMGLGGKMNITSSPNLNNVGGVPPRALAVGGGQ
jgi:hypothetical protein